MSTETQIRELLTECYELIGNLLNQYPITLECSGCGYKMTSEHFKADDRIICPDCWVI